MVLFAKNNDMDETMPQTVPSAGFTPPCDYSNFADSFDLSLLPGDEPFSASTLFYQTPLEPAADKPKTYANGVCFYPSPPSESDLDLCPDFQTLLVPEDGLFGGYRHSGGEASFYPSSPEAYSASPGSAYSRSPCGDELHRGLHVKEEAYSPLPSFDSFAIKEEVSEPEVKKEDSELSCLRRLLQDHPLSAEEAAPPEDHRALRQVLRDTSFQRKFNLRPIDLGFLGGGGEVKMEEDGERRSEKQMDEEEEYLLRGCEEEIVQESIAPVLNLAIEQMRQDVDTTCATLGISTDPSQWNSASVLSWIRWTSRQFGLPEPAADQWDMAGPTLVALSEEDFTRRASQGGMILHAQLEIWKAAYSDTNLRMQWRPETTSSNASSGDISEDEEEEAAPNPESSKPAASRPGTHIHLWQFLKELLASPQANGSCIRWLDRSKGIFKIEDSVKVAKLWGKRKNRPAMNYDKLSRSIRQYYKKGIMKKTERSQRLVYQFCHPYSL